MTRRMTPLTVIVVAAALSMGWGAAANGCPDVSSALATDGQDYDSATHYVAQPASLLHPGMTAEEVADAMGPPTLETVGARTDPVLHGLSYAASARSPMPTEVVLTDGWLTGVRMDVASADRAALPEFVQPVVPQMVRAGVFLLLGRPRRDIWHAVAATAVEQLEYGLADRSVVSIFLVDGRVAGIHRGEAVPHDLLGLTLPAEPPCDAAPQQQLRIGMRAKEVRRLQGRPTSVIEAAFRGRPVEYVAYEARAQRPATRLTLIDGVLTEFSLDLPGSIADSGDTCCNEMPATRPQH